MKEENLKVGFILQFIKTEQFAVFEENYYAKKEVKLNSQFQFKIDQTNKQIGVFLTFEFVQLKKTFLKIIVSCHFKITDDSWNNFVQLNESKLLIPKQFLAHLAMITLSTSRGVLFAKTECTQFSKFIVPLLNVSQMITEDASFDLKID